MKGPLLAVTMKCYRPMCPVPRSATLLLWIYTVSLKKLQNLFLSERHQISTNFDNFWQNDVKEAKIMRGAPIFHLI